jgi:hypothetical protein
VAAKSLQGTIDFIGGTLPNEPLRAHALAYLKKRGDNLAARSGVSRCRKALRHIVHALENTNYAFEALPEDFIQTQISAPLEESGMPQRETRMVATEANYFFEFLRTECRVRLPAPAVSKAKQEAPIARREASSTADEDEADDDDDDADEAQDEEQASEVGDDEPEQSNMSIDPKSLGGLPLPTTTTLVDPTAAAATLANMAFKIRVSRLEANGQESICGEYDAEAVAGHATLEGFVLAVIAPTWGPFPHETRRQFKCDYIRGGVAVRTAIVPLAGQKGAPVAAAPAPAPVVTPPALPAPPHPASPVEDALATAAAMDARVAQRVREERAQEAQARAAGAQNPEMVALRAELAELRGHVQASTAAAAAAAARPTPAPITTAAFLKPDPNDSQPLVAVVERMMKENAALAAEVVRVTDARTQSTPTPAKVVEEQMGVLGIVVQLMDKLRPATPANDPQVEMLRAELHRQQLENRDREHKMELERQKSDMERLKGTQAGDPLTQMHKTLETVRSIFPNVDPTKRTEKGVLEILAPVLAEGMKYVPAIIGTLGSALTARAAAAPPAQQGVPSTPSQAQPQQAQLPAATQMSSVQPSEPAQAAQAAAVAQVPAEDAASAPLRRRAQNGLIKGSLPPGLRMCVDQLVVAGSEQAVARSSRMTMNALGQEAEKDTDSGRSALKFLADLDSFVTTQDVPATTVAMGNFFETIGYGDDVPPERCNVIVGIMLRMAKGEFPEHVAAPAPAAPAPAPVVEAAPPAPIVVEQEQQQLSLAMPAAQATIEAAPAAG